MPRLKGEKPPENMEEAFAAAIRWEQAHMNPPNGGWTREKLKAKMERIVGLQMLMEDEPRAEGEKPSAQMLDVYVEDRFLKKGWKILHSNLFKAFTAAKSDEEIMDACRNPQRFSTEFVKQSLHFTRLAQNPDSPASIYNITKSSVSALTATGKEDSSSPEYTAMLKTARDMQNSTWGTMQASDGRAAKTYRMQTAAMRYIETHLSPRWTQTGKTRFNEALKLVAQTMPRDQFRDYVARLNRERGTEKGRNHLDPNHFRQHTPAQILQQAHDKAAKNLPVSSTDAARIAAAYELGMRPGENGAPRMDQPLTMDALIKKAREIEQKPQFQRWLKQTGPERLKEAILSNPAQIAGYQKEAPEVVRGNKVVLE